MDEESLPEEHRDDSNVVVAVRLRPPDEVGEDIKSTYRSTPNTLIVNDPLFRGRAEHHFKFNHVFLPEHGQGTVFQYVAKPLIDHLLKGFNSCCFAYGQTGSGKTHSVFGEGNTDQRGMLARSIEYLFERIEKVAVSKEVGMAVSFAEVYLDQVRDLGRFYVEEQLRRLNAAEDSLGTPRGNTRRRLRAPSEEYLSQDLEIHETPQGLVYVEDLALIPVSNIREVLEVANLGVRMRATFETRLNSQSSRSHTIFTVSVAQRSKTDKGGILASTVNFVDLAGSERLSRSQSEGRRFQEAVVINSSLSALGKVVLALATSHRGHIPYRDSKLTRILQSSLGGNSYTTLLATIDPSAKNYEESLSSLQFADRCKSVRNKPVPGQASSGEEDAQERLVHSLLAEISTLQRRLDERNRANMGLPARPGAPGGADQEDGDPEGLRGGESEAGDRLSTSCATTSKYYGLVRQATARLQADQQKTREAEEAADTFGERIREEWREHHKEDLEQRRQAAALRQKHREIQVEITKCECQLSHIASGITSDLNREMKAREEFAADAVERRARLLRRLPRELALDPPSNRLDKKIGEKVAAQDERRFQSAQAISQGFQAECALVEMQYQQQLAEKESEIETMEQELELLLRHGKAFHDQLDLDIAAAQEAARRLRLLSESSGLALLPRDTLHLPTLELAEFRSRLAEEGLLPNRDLDPLRQELLGLSRQVAKILRTVQISSRSGTDGGQPVDVAGNAWDADAFARSLCAAGGGMDAAASGAEVLDAMRYLDPGRQRLLCHVLWRRARLPPKDFDVERGSMRDDVAKECSTHCRVDEIRQLERDIEAYNTQLAGAEERARLLTSSLRCCGGSMGKLGSGTSRPTSARKRARSVGLPTLATA